MATTNDPVIGDGPRPATAVGTDHRPTDAPLVVADEISVVFGHGPYAFTAVDRASVEIHRGEIVGVVGESGSGKTTIARVIAGLQRATSGELRIGGAPAGGRRHRRTDIQMVFQDPYSSLNPRQTAVQAVAEAVKVRQGLPARAAKERALELLRSIGIGDALAERRPAVLSGGQLQRVSVARALAADPSLLIADEPTSALDQSAQAQLLNLLRHIQAERDLTILFISHDLGIIHYLTDRVYVMERGVVVESGITTEVFAAPADDYTRLLINSIPGRRDHLDAGSRAAHRR